MSNDGTERPLIAPPPGIIPSPASPEEPESPGGTEESEFISLPPGVSVPDLDSGTHRLTNPRRGRATASDVGRGDADASPPVFFPTAAPGMPVPSPPSPDGEPPAADASLEPEEPTGPVATQSMSAQPAPVGPTVSPAAPPAAWTLHLVDGTTMPLTSTTIVGRRPSAVEQWPDAQLLPLADESRSISKTHAALVLDVSGTLTLWDLNSTNGTFLEHPGGAEVEVLAGAPVTVPPGSVLGFGEYSATVERT